ncbi:hypothetical protein [Arsenicibacter rosenii]|uniref:Uncharacterized protein n=1 Tax=Arsenicibacter rosenii TaxID=1750698 RepID=A0A1S2VKA3_9BACT|nr:hypothetical protein [Arsenicibacter rosenii]OIN58655.1 hypothetical protein BLX24_13900 [Arsenicibacter rosenii]
MKEKELRFFSVEENSKPGPKKETKEVELTGTISAFGKLVFPSKTVEQLGINPETAAFKIATQAGKRKIKSLYLIPDTDGGADTFKMEQTGRGYCIPLALILQNNGVDFSKSKFNFTVKPFEYGNITGYELQIEDQAPKPEYTGKPRGRKRKVVEAAE